MTNKIEKELARISLVLNEVAEEVFEEIKNKSTTIKELEDEFIIIKRSILYDHAGKVKFAYLIKKVEELIEKEKNEMPLTNRS